MKTELEQARDELQRQLRRFGVKPKRPELVMVTRTIGLRADKVERFKRLQEKGRA